MFPSPEHFIAFPRHLSPPSFLSLDGYRKQINPRTATRQRVTSLVEKEPEQLRDSMPPITSYQDPSVLSTIRAAAEDGKKRRKALTKPSTKEVHILRVLQARLVEEEARGTVADVDGGGFPLLSTAISVFTPNQQTYQGR